MDDSDLFRPLTFAGTIKRSFHLYFDNFHELTDIHFLVFISCLCLDYAFRFTIGKFDAAMYLAGMIGHVVIDGAVCHMVATIYIGEETGCLKSIEAAWQSNWSLLGFDFLLKEIINWTPGLLNFASVFIQWKEFVDLTPPPTPNLKPMTPTLLKVPFHFLHAAVAIMEFLFLVGGHYAWSRALLAGPAIVVEGIGNPIKGLRRSWGLSTGHCYYPMCTIVFNAILRLLPTVLQKAGIIGAFHLGMFFRPLFAIVATVLYLNQRIDRENLNAEVLAREINGIAVDEAAQNGEEVRANPEPLFAALDTRSWFYLAILLLWPVSMHLELFSFWIIHTLVVAAIIPKVFRLWRMQNN